MLREKAFCKASCALGRDDGSSWVSVTLWVVPPAPHAAAAPPPPVRRDITLPKNPSSLKIKVVKLFL